MDLQVTQEEVAAWKDTARDMYIPYDERLSVHPQDDSFTDHQVWDFASTGEDQYPLLLHFPYFDLYRKQVTKQADLVLAMHLRGDAFNADEKSRNFAYYERITVRDSSLSACSQAVIAAETGHVDLAHDYVGEAALMDLADLEHNTRDGLHMASLAGAWIALVEGLGGLRIDENRLVFCPRLPDGIRSLNFRVTYRGRRIKVGLTNSQACYQLLSGDAVSVWHYDEELHLAGDRAESRSLPSRPNLPRPHQPPGREPVRRRAG
jgi:alpha,alpha-trehalose phosphorylase